jgi:hypothetical protein
VITCDIICVILFRKEAFVPPLYVLYNCHWSYRAIFRHIIGDKRTGQRKALNEGTSYRIMKISLMGSKKDLDETKLYAMS